jgi:hypothetical protein
LNFLYLQILNAQSSGGSESSSRGSNIILPLLSNNVSYRSDINSQTYSLTVFLNSLEQKIIELQNAAPAESGSGLSIEQEEKLAIISIPHSADSRLFLDPAYSIAYTQEYLDPVLNYTDHIRFQQRDPNGPVTDKRGVPIDIKHDKSKGALVIKMNTPEIILPDQFRVVLDYTEDTITFIRPGAPYDTTDKYYKATLGFGTDNRKVDTYNVDHYGTRLYNIINTLQTEVEELKTRLNNLNTTQISHNAGLSSFTIIRTLKEQLSAMTEDSNKHCSSNGYIYNQTAFLDYLDAAVKKCYLKADGHDVYLPGYPPEIGQLN